MESEVWTRHVEILTKKKKKDRLERNTDSEKREFTQKIEKGKGKRKERKEIKNIKQSC